MQSRTKHKPENKIMELFHVSLFNDQSPDIQEGWNFFKGSLEITNPDGSTSLFGDIKNSFGKESITLYNGFLNYEHPHYLKNDLRQSETCDYFLLTMVSDGYIVLPKGVSKNCKNVRIEPKRKKDKSLVLITLCLKKDEEFNIKVKSPLDGKISDILIHYSSLLSNLLVEDITPVIKRPTLTLKAFRFLLRLLYKRPGIFCGL